MRRIALLCPNEWDQVMLSQSAGGVLSRFDVIPFQAGESEMGSFQANLFIDRTVAQFRSTPVDGVTSSGDYPGALVSAFVAEELGLPGPRPSAVLACSHKYYGRLAQTAVAPDATPQFGLLHPDALDERLLPLPFPFFVKPVKSWFSQYAQKVHSWEELVVYANSEGLRHHLTTFVKPFNDLLDRHGGFEIDGGWLIAEEILVGRQVTVEAYIFDSHLHPVGIVDSVMYGRTLSFRYFGYPSTTISDDVASRMLEIAARVLGSIEFDNGLFNVEFMYNDVNDTVHIIEVNPRMCGQFADLMESVEGVNTYETLMSLAIGEQPLPGIRGRYQVAASFALRHFGDAEVLATPDGRTISAARDLIPITSLHSFYETGQLLSESQYEYDGLSYRYAVVNLAGQNWAQLFDDFAAAEQLLDFRFLPTV